MHAPFKRQVERKVAPSEGLFSLRLPKYESYQPSILNSPTAMLFTLCAPYNARKSLPQPHVGNAANANRLCCTISAESAEFPRQHARILIPTDSAVRVRSPAMESVSAVGFPRSTADLRGGIHARRAARPICTRRTFNREQLVEVIACGRPGTEMPHFDKYAYEDTNCYGLGGKDLGADAPRFPHSTSLTSARSRQSSITSSKHSSRRFKSEVQQCGIDGTAE
jgi:hypothetical protein